MRPFYFGTSKEPLFGTYHPAAARPARRTAVLLCNPFGQEAIFAHRVFRVMADRLARAGFHVLRFDYYATGDSSGDCRDATLARWVDDVLTASDELTDTAGVQDAAWVGLRLGGNVAALASARYAGRLAALVLWDPVTDGTAYLDDLRRAHLKLLAEDLDFPPRHAFAGGTADAVRIDQALGFAIPPELHAGIRDMTADRMASLEAGRVFVVESQAAGTPDDWRQTLAGRGQQVAWKRLDVSEAWNSEDALNSTVIPVAALDAVMACLEDLR